MEYNYTFNPFWNIVDAVTTAAGDVSRQAQSQQQMAGSGHGHGHGQRGNRAHRHRGGRQQQTSGVQDNSSNALSVFPSYQDWGLGNWFGDAMSNENNLSTPAIDLYDTPGAYIVTAEVVGCSPDEIDVDFDPYTGELKVSGETSSHYDKNLAPEEADEHRKSYLKWSERRYGKFERRIRVPADPKVVEDDINAEVNNGVLKVTLPKMEAPKNVEKKKIKVTLNTEEEEGKESTK